MALVLDTWPPKSPENTFLLLEAPQFVGICSTRHSKLIHCLSYRWVAGSQRFLKVKLAS